MKEYIKQFIYLLDKQAKKSISFLIMAFFCQSFSFRLKARLNSNNVDCYVNHVFLPALIFISSVIIGILSRMFLLIINPYFTNWLVMIFAALGLNKISTNVTHSSGVKTAFNQVLHYLIENTMVSVLSLSKLNQFKNIMECTG